jgi:dihydrodipicolinate synthase/N-acetylneuraminate lyase
MVNNAQEAHVGRMSSDPAGMVRGVTPVLEVPFTAEGEVDYAGFGRVVSYVFGAGVTSVMFPGFASEYHKLSEDERWRLSAVLLDYTRSRADAAAVMAVQDHATKLAVDRSVRLVEEGADLINLLPPHFLGPPAAAVREHVKAVLAAVAPTPVVLQYAPNQTGTSLDAVSIAEIARSHPNLTLVKVESTPPGALIGVQPGCSFTEIYVELWRLFEAGKAEAAVELHTKLLPYISYWMLHSELIVAAEKLVSVRRGLFDSAYCRAPAHTLDADEVTMVDRFLEEFAGYLPSLSS